MEVLDQTFMPKRILDLGSIALPNGDVRLVEVHKDLEQPDAALSYCWGEAQNVRLTLDLFDQFTSHGVPLSDLPMTIQDACS